MTTSPVNVDFKTFAKSFREYVLDKAKQAGSTIVYALDGNIVEEDPKSGNIKILRKYIF